MFHLYKREYFKDKIFLFTSAYHPIAKEFILYLYEQKAKLILIGKHPALLSFIEKKITNPEQYRKARKEYLLTFSIDTRNYLHVKKAFQKILKEWQQIHFIFHFDDYYYENTIENFPVHNFKLHLQWNLLSCFNIIKAQKTYFSSPSEIIITQNLNSHSLYFFLKKSIIQYWISQKIPITTMYIPEELIIQSKKSPKKKYLKKRYLSSQTIQNILNIIFKNSKNRYFSFFRKNEIRINNFDLLLSCILYFGYLLW